MFIASADLATPFLTVLSIMGAELYVVKFTKETESGNLGYSKPLWSTCREARKTCEFSVPVTSHSHYRVTWHKPVKG